MKYDLFDWEVRIVKERLESLYVKINQNGRGDVDHSVHLNGKTEVKFNQSW